MSIDFNATDFKLLQINLSFEAIHNCSTAKTMIKDKWERTNRNKYEIVNDEDVSFKMLRSNETLLEQELDKLRNKPTKFICLNDNFDHGTNRTQEHRLKQILYQFYQSLLPIRSHFEHSPSYTNPYLYIEPYRKWHSKNVKNRRISDQTVWYLLKLNYLYMFINLCLLIKLFFI